MGPGATTLTRTIESKKPDKVLVRAGIVFVFAVFPGEGRPALVEHPGQNDVAAQTDAKAPWRAFSQISKRSVSFHNFVVFWLFLLVHKFHCSVL